MALLIVNAHSGYQETRVVIGKGKYLHPERLVWDERVDGEISKQQLEYLGGLERIKNDGKPALVVNELKYREQKAKIQAENEQKTREKEAIKALKQRLLEAKIAENPTVSELKNQVETCLLVLKELAPLIQEGE